ncbi:MAG TPA: hypothetical protein VNC78_06595 [Actinomycetota bacterium]|nr:hypothetical protein [Actinomycetota bacterium]
MPDVVPEGVRGAYGLRVGGLSAASHLLPRADPAWPLVEVTVMGNARKAPPSEDEDTRVLYMPEGGYVVLERRGAVTFHPDSSIPEEEIVHPLLGPIGAIFAQWMGREPLHAAAFIHGGAAWGLVGPSLSGKSTLLAHLHAEGYPILTDDLVVVEDRTVFAGPLCLDLRSSPPEIESGIPARRGTRQRIVFDESVPDAGLGGFFYLRWGSTLKAEPVPPPERIRYLADNRRSNWAPLDPGALVHLARFPAWVVSRPEDGLAAESLALILDVIARQPRGL